MPDRMNNIWIDIFSIFPKKLSSKCKTQFVVEESVVDVIKPLFSLIPRTSKPGVNFTNILWAAFAPKSFCQKITNPNCKHLKAVQRTLVWLSISPIFYVQLFHTKVLCAPFMCLQFGFVIFWQMDFGAKAAHKMLVKLTPGGSMGPIYILQLLLSEKSQDCS